MEVNIPQPEAGFQDMGGGLYIVHSEKGLEAAMLHDTHVLDDVDVADYLEDFIEKFEPEYPCFVTVATLNKFGAYYSTYAKV